MIGFLKLIVCFGVYFLVLNNAECQVTVSNLNGTGNFLCGHRTLLECYIPGYSGGMNWKLDGTIIAQCAFGSCTALGALPSGDDFTFDGSAGKFNLNIGITHADNGTKYQCDDGAASDQTTVNIQVPPSESAFTMNITETSTSITVEAGCFYPSNAGRMDVICDKDGTKVGETITMTPTTTECTGDCAGPNIYTAVGSYEIDNSTMGGNSRYRFEVYYEGFKDYAVTNYSSAIYDCGVTTTLPTTVTQTTSTSNTTDISSNITTESTKITQTSNITTEPSSTTQTIFTFSSTGQSTSPPTSGPDCGRTCIIIIVVCVVVLFIIIIIVCWCIRKQKQKKDTKDEMNDTKQDQNNIPSRESDYNKINEKKQDQNKMEHKL